VLCCCQRASYPLTAPGIRDRGEATDMPGSVLSIVTRGRTHAGTGSSRRFHLHPGSAPANERTFTHTLMRYFPRGSLNAPAIFLRTGRFVDHDLVHHLRKSRNPFPHRLIHFTGRSRTTATLRIRKTGAAQI